MNKENTGENGSENNHDPSQNRNRGTLQKKVKDGSIWTITSQAGSQISRFLSNLIMTRLLFEEAFGIMAIVTTFLVGLTLFSDIGIGLSIIQNKRGEEPEFYNTAWSLQIGRGLFLSFVALIGSIPFSILYNEPMLAKLIPVSGLNALILGLSSTKLFTQRRNLNLKPVAIIEILSQITGLVVMIVWAYLNRSIWALVGGGLAASLTKTILSHTVLTGEKNRLHWSRIDARSIFNFGRWIFLSTIITFLAQQSDRLIFGKMIPFTMLGIYHIGSTFANIPAILIKHLTIRVFFPLFSRINETNEDVHSVFIQTRWIILVFAGWSFSGLIAGGTAIIDLLYDDRYLQAGWIVQFVSIGCWFSICMDSYGAVLLAKAKTLLLAISHVTKFISMVIFILLGNKYYGFQGAVIGIAASELVRLLFISTVSARIGLPAWHQDLVLGVLVAAISTGVMFFDLYLTDHGYHVFIRVAVIFILVSILWAPLMITVYKKIIQKRLQQA